MQNSFNVVIIIMVFVGDDMKKIKKAIALMCLLFAVNACSCSSKTSIKVTKVNKEKNINSQVNDVEFYSDLDEDYKADINKVYNNLIKLANYSFADMKELDNTIDYVSTLTSFEYTDSKVEFCALCDKQDSYNNLVVILINYESESPSQFFDEMLYSEINNSTIGKFRIFTDIKVLYISESINDKFDDWKNVSFPSFDENRPFKRASYQDEDNAKPYDTYFSLTYMGTDSKIHSINRVLNDYIDNVFAYDHEYAVAKAECEDMYFLLSKILEDNN